MGSAFSSLMKWFSFTKEKVRIVMVGLDGAGKTTILYLLKFNEFFSTIPTIGFNVETIEYKNLQFTIWDINGQQLTRNFWQHYIMNTTAIIFVVDSSDIDRISDAGEELQKVMKHPKLKNTVLLVLANKQDLPNAISVDEMTTNLRLKELEQIWHIQPVVATKGQGLWEGLDCLSEMLNKLRK